MSSGWQFWVDRGGTFTDVIGLSPQGRLHVRKLLSAADATDPAVAAIGYILSSVATATPGSGAGVIRQVKVGTTVGTNALLERKGSPVVLVTTRGFGDALRIGYQNRPDIFARHIVLPEQLYSAVIEAEERIDAGGNVITALDTPQLRQALSDARRNGFRSVAIVFLHGWRFSQHEHAAARLARELGFEEVSVSHELAPLVRYVSRGDTTVLNGYLALPLRGYLDGLQGALHALDARAQLQVMQSNGGLAPAEHFHALASVLSGPAGGLIGMQWIGQRLGLQQLVGFDMGGTSTDVSLIDGELPQRFEHQIAGIRLQTPMLDVHTIAAGGGSILQFAEDRCAVGPDSAGARPGPACYGLGGPLTLTDVQVLLGRLRAETLPAVFGPQGSSRIDPAATTAGFERLQQVLTASGSAPESLQALAASFLDVAVESMANAIHQVSTRQGLDVRQFTLFCFGGAAGQHACRVAQAVGMTRILVHPLASVLSAFGIGVADRLATRRASLRLPLTAAGLESAHSRLAELEREARAAVAAEPGAAAPETGARDMSSVSSSRWLELRGGDSETTLSVSATSLATARQEFAAAHLRRFGFTAATDLIIEAVRVEARAASIDASSLQMPTAVGSASLPSSVRAWFGEWREVPLLPPAAVYPGLTGPALIVEPNSTVVVEPGWSVQRLSGGELILEQTAAMPSVPAPAHPAIMPPDPARLEIFNNLFMHIAEQMGEVLKATAQSVNIKERLDYSCALFDGEGGLVANAPHMPVHLGSMGACVRAVIEATGGSMSAEDSWLLNSPYHGGTHLPDMTVVTPVFMAGGARPDFFVASRAHHADIGGSTPGSMPAFSRSIDEEGVLFACFPLVSAGVLRERELRQALQTARYPARNPDQNVADLRAQLAANARGIAELARAQRRYSLAVIHRFMHEVQANAAASVRRAIERLTPGSFRYEMDGGQIIAVRIDVDAQQRRARVDFAGTSAQGAHNFNAPRAVCVAAVLYVFRTLIDRAIPLNEGCLEPLEILIPPGSMLDPRPPAAVAAGNVETSQCIVDALYGALGVLAASQGTMNNLTFGDESLQYYETIAGGSGAGPGFDGCDAVQTHMTNSRLTDPEILEARFPVLLREFAIRHRSGGAGRHRGGDGVIRRLLFRAPLCGALLANHRRVAPFGLHGGAAATTGEAWIHRRDGSVERLDATASFDLSAGDELRILTPGGGGFGAQSR